MLLKNQDNLSFLKSIKTKDRYLIRNIMNYYQMSVFEVSVDNIYNSLTILR